MTIFPEQIAQAVRTDDNFFNGYPEPFKQMYQIRSKTANFKECFRVRGQAKEVTKYVHYVH